MCLFIFYTPDRCTESAQRWRARQTTQTLHIPYGLCDILVYVAHISASIQTNGFSLSFLARRTPYPPSTIITSKQLHTFVHISRIKSYRLVWNTRSAHSIDQKIQKKLWNMQQRWMYDMSHLISSVFLLNDALFMYTIRKCDIYTLDEHQDDINMRCCWRRLYAPGWWLSCYLDMLGNS